MAAPLDSLIGEGLAPSPYTEMKAHRDALWLVAALACTAIERGFVTNQASTDHDWTGTILALWERALQARVI